MSEGCRRHVKIETIIGGGIPIAIYSSNCGQMSIGIDGHRLKNSYNLSYDDNKHHHCVRRPLISKYSYISAK